MTKDLNGVAKFFPNNCEFQNLSTRNKIHSAREVNGLYYFEEDLNVSKCFSQATHVCTSLLCEDEIKLWHLKLGYPSSSYLKAYHPTSFQNKKVVNFQCEVCELSKHHYAHFPIQTYKQSQPFRSAREVNGLYYFEEDLNVSKCFSQAIHIGTSLLCEDKIKLWHRKLGHPSSSSLKDFHSTLFKNKKVINFQCEVCESSKRHHAHFPI